MKESGIQVKVTMTPALYGQAKAKAERVGLSIAGYLRLLTINDLRQGEDEKLGLVKAEGKSAAAPTQPQVIVVNNDGDYRAARERGAGTSHLEDDNHAASSKRQTVRLDDLLNIL